jgi:serpin B
MSYGRFPLAILFVAGVFGGLLMSSCKEESNASFSVVQASDSRNEDPSVTVEGLAPLVEGNTAFATDLYAALAQGSNGNLFFSPYSISVALAMTYAGAAGDTAAEMADTLHFNLPSDQLHAAFNRLDLELEARGKADADDGGEPFELSIANSIWAEKTYDFQMQFLRTLAQNYGAGARLVDFVNDPEGARRAINSWVNDETNDRIPELIPEGIIDAMTRLVLTNAIYFKASWAEPFAKESTQSGDFTLLSGSTVQAQMMQSEGTPSFLYSEGADYQAVELTYTGDEVGMLVILPAEGEFEAFEAGFDADRLAQIVGSLQASAVRVSLPKFEFSSDVGLNQTLANLGMPQAFQPGVADFSGMDGTHDLYISDVIHKAFVAVDEEGTEAAAATAVIIGVTSAPLEPKTFEANRPFIFVIGDRVTGAILFIGRVTDPTQ